MTDIGYLGQLEPDTILDINFVDCEALVRPYLSKMNVKCEAEFHWSTPVVDVSYDLVVWLGDYIDMTWANHFTCPVVAIVRTPLCSIEKVNVVNGTPSDLTAAIQCGRIIPFTGSYCHGIPLVLENVSPRVLLPRATLESPQKTRAQTRSELEIEDDVVMLFARIDESAVAFAMDKSNAREDILPPDDHNTRLLLHVLSRLCMYTDKVKLVLSCDHPRFSQYVARLVGKLKKTHAIFDTHWKAVVKSNKLIMTSSDIDGTLDLLGACDMFLHPHLAPDIGGLPLIALTLGVLTLIPIGSAYEELNVKLGDMFLYERVPCLPLEHKASGEKYMVVSPNQLTETILKCMNDLDILRRKTECGSQKLREILDSSTELSEYLYYVRTTSQHPSYPQL